MTLLLRLFYEFFKVGLFSVGGGLATIPFLEDMMYKTGWFTMSDLTNLIAVSECTPGPMGINMATYVGNILMGPVGSVVAVVGLVTPSLVIIILISIFLKNFSQLPVVQHAFAGLRPASTALICTAAISVAKVSVVDLDLFAQTGSFLSVFKWKELVLAIVVFICIRKFKKHPIWYIVAGAIVGIIFQL